MCYYLNKEAPVRFPQKADSSLHKFKNELGKVIRLADLLDHQNSIIIIISNLISTFVNRYVFRLIQASVWCRSTHHEKY